MHYIVTGGCGFIGAHLVSALLERGHEITIIDDLSNATADTVPAAAKLVIADITTPQLLDAHVELTDGVFHLAAVVSVNQSTQDWRATHEVTLGGTVAVLDALARKKRVPIVIASSAAVYGDCHDVPLEETAVCTPLSAYGADKLACELHARVGHHMHHIPAIALRFFNVYGPGQNAASPYAGVISIFTERMRRNEPITIYGDGEQTRDYIYVSDVVASMLAAMHKLEDKSIHFGVYNVCTGIPVSVNQLATTIAAATGSASAIRYAPARNDDIRISLGEQELAEKALGFSAQTRLEQGLELMLKNS